MLIVSALLLPAMDMSLCGDGVQAVTTWWPLHLTAAGFAVVATLAGVRLDGPVRKSVEPISLPKGIATSIHPLAKL